MLSFMLYPTTICVIFQIPDVISSLFSILNIMWNNVKNKRTRKRKHKQALSEKTLFYSEKLNWGQYNNTPCICITYTLLTFEWTSSWRTQNDWRLRSKEERYSFFKYGCRTCYSNTAERGLWKIELKRLQKKVTRSVRKCSHQQWWTEGCCRSISSGINHCCSLPDVNGNHLTSSVSNQEQNVHSIQNQLLLKSNDRSIVWKENGGNDLQLWIAKMIQPKPLQKRNNAWKILLETSKVQSRGIIWYDFNFNWSKWWSKKILDTKILHEKTERKTQKTDREKNIWIWCLVCQAINFAHFVRALC